MIQNTVSQRIAKMVDHFTKGNKSAFAKEVGISNQSLGEIVGPKQGSPSFAALQKIALAYPSVSLHWLVLGEGGEEIVFELTDEDKAHKLEQYAGEVEHHTRQLYDLGYLSSEEYLPSTNDIDKLRTQEELSRIELIEAVERERKFARVMQHAQERAGHEGVQQKEIKPTIAQQELALAEEQYLIAVRNRMRAERAQIGFSTDSSTAVYRLDDGGEPDTNSLYGGRLSTRLSISNESAEELVKSGKIRATYIDGEGYRITEQAVRIFLGEF